MNIEDPINLVYLKYFCDALRLGGLSAAATTNFVTQSAISQGITKLEKSLGIALLAHHPNRLRPTPEGEFTFRQGLDILKRTSDFKQEVTTKGSDLIGDLDFGCTYSFALAVLPGYLKHFRSNHPQVRINCNLGRNEEIKRMVKSGTTDFGILPDEGDLTGFAKRDIYKGKLHLYCSSRIPKKDHKKLGFILAASHSQETILLKDAYYKKFGKPLVGILEANGWTVIANLVAEGMGIGYFPDYIAQQRKEAFQVCNLPIEPHNYTLSAIYPRGMQLRKSSELCLSNFSSLHKGGAG
jgi:DNA-binding transcriptional LysR family regulator